ncbi:MAG: PdaC/SigV domain-containing protein [Ruminococcus sp.]|jgi:tetratricopeptide (TPR) repeat protein
MYCGRCGAYNDESSRYCENCGNALYADPGYSRQHRQNRPENRKRRVLWAVIIAAMAVILAVIAVILWQRTAQQERYTKQLTLGEQYLAELNYEDAEICFRQAIEINPRQAQPYIQLSTVFVETQRYEEAEEILQEALEVIPAKETKKTEAIERRLSEVQKLIEDTEESENAEEDPLTVAMNVLGYPYLSDNSYTMQFVHEDTYYLTEGMDDEGILSADSFDYDQDGENEILVLVLSRQQTRWKYSSAFVLNMLEKDEDGNWTRGAETVLEADLKGAYSPARIEFFAREYGDHVGIFLEDTSLARHFADGMSWRLTQVAYQNQAFGQVGEEIYTAGSDDIANACFEMDDTYYPEGYEEGRQTILNFINSVHELELYPERIGWDAPLTDQDSSLRKILRIEKSTEITPQQAQEWMQSGASQPLGPVSVAITDFRKTEEAEEASAEGSYQAEIVTYQGNADIQYPQFSPSSPSVDQWNTYFEEKAAAVQKSQDDMWADGITNAWAKQKAEIVYQEGNMVSIRFLSDEYYGGAHGMTREFGETIDLSSDHLYTLPELLNTDTATAQQMVNDGFNQLIAQNPGEFFEDAVSDVSADFSEVGYYRTPEGIKVISTLYWLAPYAAGTREILLQPVGE